MTAPARDASSFNSPDHNTVDDAARHWPMRVAGRWQDSADVVEVHSSWDQRLVGTTSLANAEQLERATAAAAAAFAEMRKEPRWKRSRACQAIADGIAARADELARLITRESGKPIQYARAEVARAIATFTMAAEEANRLGGEIIPLDVTPASDGYSGYALREPAGPIAAISPFNFPLNLVAHKVAPALACGCPVVLKPAPQAPLTALALAEIVAAVEDAHPSALQILPMSVPLAETLVADDRYALLSFTGSARVGWHLKSICGRKRVVLELGGNAAGIIHGDSDLQWAVERAAASAFAAAGQVCIKLQRIYVERPIFDEFVSRFVTAVQRLKVGDPMESDAVIGPLIDESSAKRVDTWIDEAITAGAKVLLRGKRHGALLDPAVLTSVPSHAKISCEEVFGPVAVVEPYDNFDDTLHLANSTSYGLQASIFTGDIDRIQRAVAALDVGGVIVNDSPSFRVDNMPYGGVKASGLGREGVRYAIEEMTRLKMVAMRASTARK